MTFWTRLSPKAKRNVVIGGIAVGLVAISQIAPDMRAKTGADPRKHPTKESILTEKKTRDMGEDALAAQLRESMSRTANLEREVKELRQQSGRLTPDEQSKAITDMQKQMRAMSDDLGRSHQEADEVTKAAVDAAKKAVADLPRPAPVAASPAAAAKSKDKLPADIWGNANLARPEPANFGAQASPVSSGSPPSVADIKTVTEKKDDRISNAEKRSLEQTAFFLPAGSMISGVLITGMDAPTGKMAMQNPYPALMRIKSEALLPNRFRADIRECFVLLSGSGDLASERANLRGETLSCVRKDQRIVEAAFPSFSTGEDGKDGIRGRLVQKQGQMIANALLAGFASGVSKAFQVQAVPVLQTQPTGTAQYQTTFTPQAGESALVGGAGNALNQIADYYIKMAQETFPVIEIDAGRRVNLIVMKGITVKFMDPEALRRQQLEEAKLAQSASGGRGTATSMNPLGAAQSVVQGAQTGQQQGYFNYQQQQGVSTFGIAH
jgi:conjugal transfer pilus assembly protein TraB